VTKYPKMNEVIFSLEEVDVLINVLKKRKKQKKEVFIDDLTGKCMIKQDDGTLKEVDETETETESETGTGTAFQSNPYLPMMLQGATVIRKDSDKSKGELFENSNDLFKNINKSKLSTDELTLKGFLEVMDGVYDSPGRIVTMSTNHPEKLDPAILRHGRISMRIHLSGMKLEQLI